jgi:hypothetical protein
MRRLPIPVPPAQGETIKSYLQRLASVHGVLYEELWSWVSVSDTGYPKQRHIAGQRLADATGYPLTRLATALPELDPATDWLLLRDTPQPACPRCTARHQGGPIMRLFAHHHYVCARHGYWLGPPDVGYGPSLRHLGDLPDLVAAQRKHRRLVQAYGPIPVFDALIHAFKICALLWRNGPEETDGDSRWWHWDQRLDLLIPKTDSRGSFSHSLCYAAIYPEAVTIAGLLTHPTWRAKGTSRLGHPDNDDRWELSAEFGHRLGLADYYPEDPKHPLNLWADHHAAQPPITPVAFPQRRYKNSDGAPPTPSVRAVRRHHEQARYFAKKRYAATILIYHHHTNAPMIDTYYPNPGPYARQRARFAADAAEYINHTALGTPQDGIGVLNERRLNAGKRLLILPDGQQRVVPSDATNEELAARYQLDKIFRMPLTD